MIHPSAVVLIAVSLFLGTATIPMQADAQTVVNLPARDQVIRRPARTLFTVGRAEGGGADVFGHVADVGFDAAENLYVLDRLNARVVVFDSTGRLVRTMGRQGGGPGEFGAPQQMVVSPTGEVIVSDLAHRALIVFGRDGRARSVPYPGPTLLIGRRLIGHPRGGVVSLAMGNPATRGANAFGEEVLLWLGTDGSPRTLASVSTPAGRQTEQGGVRVTAPPIFFPSFRFAVLRDGAIAIADDATYSVRVLGPDDRTARVLRRPIAPRRVTARDREHEIERRMRQQSAGGGLRVVGAQSGPLPAPVRRSIAEQLRDAEFARVVPVIRRLGVDASGTVWVERAGAEPGASAGVDLVDPAGRYRGTLAGWELPAAFSPGGRAAMIREDDMGVQRVVVIRL